MSAELNQYTSRKQLIDKRDFRFGDIYIISDHLINLPISDRMEGGRNHHEERWVVIISNNVENNHPFAPTVTIAPLSHRFELKRPFDLELFKRNDNVKYDCLLMLKASQPVLKVDLGTRQSAISDDKMDELMALIALYYGLDIDEEK